jgi:hypothetical protein
MCALFFELLDLIAEIGEGIDAGCGRHDGIV